MNQATMVFFPVVFAAAPWWCQLRFCGRSVKKQEVEEIVEATDRELFLLDFDMGSCWSCSFGFHGFFLNIWLILRVVFGLVSLKVFQT